MKMYIPEIGDKITLDADWKFDWINDSRNSDVIFRLSNGLFEYPFSIEANGYSCDKYLYIHKPSSPRDIIACELYSFLKYYKILESNNSIKVNSNPLSVI